MITIDKSGGYDYQYIDMFQLEGTYFDFILVRTLK